MPDNAKDKSEIDVKFDSNALLVEMENATLNRFLVYMQPNQKEKERTRRLLQALNKRGVPTRIFAEALTEAGYADNEEEDNQ